MFSTLRYFATFSFILVIIAAFAAGNYYRSVVANDIIKEIVEKDNISFAKNYVNLVWKKYSNNIEMEKLQISPEYKIVKEETDKYVSSLALARFSIYNTSHRMLINSGNSLVSFSDQHADSDFSIAAKGQVATRIIGDLWAYYLYTSDNKNRIFIRSFVPIIDNTSGSPNLKAVAELVYDITPLWVQPIMIQVIGSAVIIGIFTIIYIFLMFNITRAEREISKQHESNIDLAEAKIRAEAESREKSKFLANISHELRTPLNAIIGFSEILKDEVMGPINNDQYKEYVQDIYASGVHLLSLINDILDFSKAEAGKLDVEMIEVDVTKIMQACLRLMSPKAEDAGVSLIDEVPTDHFVVQTDPKRLKQILLNLLSNSVKFTPQSGKITLSAWYNVMEGTLNIEVTDTGIGIEPKDISKVMSTFGQIQNEYNRKYEGTGLGLPLSKKLIELMGGRFNIESQVGKGTKVSIILPKDKIIQGAPKTNS